MTHIFPATSYAIFLLGGLFQDGPYRFFLPESSMESFPGFGCELVARHSLYDQLECQLRKKFPDFVWDLDLRPDFFSLLQNEDKQETALYLVLASSRTINQFSPDHLKTFPDILRHMAKTRNRLPYLRAWQYLNGDHKLTTQALETDKLPLDSF